MLGVEYGIFSCGRWDLVPWPGIKPGSPEILATGPSQKSHLAPESKGKDEKDNLPTVAFVSENLLCFSHYHILLYNLLKISKVSVLLTW